MKKMPTDQEKEDRALCALVGYSLRVREDQELTEADRRRYEAAAEELTPSQKRSFDKVCQRVVDMAYADETRTQKQHVDSGVLALDRKKPKTGYSAKTEKELQRLRELRRKKKKQGGK